MFDGTTNTIDTTAAGNGTTATTATAAVATVATANTIAAT